MKKNPHSESSNFRLNSGRKRDSKLLKNPRDVSFPDIKSGSPIEEALTDIFTVVICNLEILQRLALENSKMISRIESALNSARRGPQLIERIMDSPNDNSRKSEG